MGLTGVSCVDPSKAVYLTIRKGENRCWLASSFSKNIHAARRPPSVGGRNLRAGLVEFSLAGLKLVSD